MSCYPPSERLIGLVTGLPSAAPSPAGVVQMAPFDSMLWLPSQAERDRCTSPLLNVL
jgi:hypothetical protein